MSYEILGFVLVAGALLAVVGFITGRLNSARLAQFIVVAAAVRFVGATLRYEMVFRFYNGLGDSVRFYREGMELTEGLWSGALSLFSEQFWIIDARWGTQFAIQLSALVTTVIGPTLRGEFLVFAAFAFLGVWLLILSFASYHDAGESLQYAWLIALWPSVWFWPSSVGKESIIVLAIGLTTYGYVGTRDHIRWVQLLAGVGLAFLVRPHVAFVLIASVVAAEGLAVGQGLTLRRLGGAAVGSAVGYYAFMGMQAKLGLMEADLEGWSELINWHMGQTLQGGSQIAAVTLSPLALPVVFANVWMRPFFWEAHNMTSMATAIEFTVLWWLVWRYRGGLLITLKNWRRNRFLRFGSLLLVSYTLMIGFTFANLGLLARQRAPVVPFLLAVLIAYPRLVVGRQEKAARRSATVAANTPAAVRAA